LLFEADLGRAGQTMPTILDVLRTHLLVPDETVAVLEQGLAALKVRLQIPVAPAPAGPKFAWPTVTETEKRSPIVQAFFIASPGYEPLLMSAGWGQVAARGMAKLAVRHGRRRAEESKWQRGVVDVIRFLARRKRQRRAILSRAKYLLQAQNESTIIESIFAAADIFEGEFMHLLKRATEGEQVDYQRITDIAASITPCLPANRGPKVSAASAAHEFLLNPEIDLSAARRPVAYQDRVAEYVDPLTAATRLEFDNTDFDSRPARRRIARQKANSGAK
jgi:hypothetical protein